MTPHFPRPQKTVLLGRARPSRSRSVGYRLHELELGGCLKARYGSPEEAALIKARFWRAASQFTHSVPGQGRRFSLTKLEGTVRLVRTA
jgi:hypothetical protein